MTLVIAHRSATATCRENTLAAFRAARELGADMVELDVRRTTDGQLVVHHDPVARPRADLDREVPSLGAALDACVPMAVNVEIKNSPDEPDWDAGGTVATAVARMLARRRLHDRVLVSSFDPTSLERVRSVDAAIPTALLTVDGSDPAALDVRVGVLGR